MSPGQPTRDIAVEASRILGIACSPTAVLLNETLAGQEATRVFEVRNIGDGRPRIESVTSDSPDLFAVRILTRGGNEPFSDHLLARVEVSLRPQPAGSYGGELTLRVKSEDQLSTVTVPVSASVCAPASVATKRLEFPQASAQGPIYERACVFRGHGGVPVVVRPQDIPGDFTVRVTDPETPAPSKLVYLRWTRPAITAGMAKSSIRSLKFVVGDGEVDHIVLVEVDCSNPR